MKRRAPIEASCHCGSVRITLPRMPRTATECNCSICRRYGVLWGYFRAREVQIRARGALSSYRWGAREIRFVRCRHCGCVTHWEAAVRTQAGRVGVNLRNLDPGRLARVRIRHLDGADTWKYLD